MRVDAPVGDTFYAFPFADEADLFEDAQIEVEIWGQRVGGSIVSIASGRLVLALAEDLGPQVKKAVLVIDATALLEALKQKIEEVKTGKLSINRLLADAVIAPAGGPADPTPIPAVAATAPTHPEKLNTAQRKAFERTLSAAITYIWGPPGCGKTTTLGEIVRTAFEGGKRVLICSNTNKAVDQVLYWVCAALGRDHPAMSMGRVIRLGRIADDKLDREYAAYVTIDSIVKRRSTELNARKAEIEGKIGQVDARATKAQQLLQRFEELDRAEERVAHLKDATNSAVRRGRQLLAEVDAIDAALDRLEKELSERSAAFFKFLKRNEEAIRRDIETYRIRRETTLKEIGTVKLRYTEMRRKFEVAQADRDQRRGVSLH